MIESAMASRTASAPWPASGGPFLTRGPSPWPSIRGSHSSIVKRVVRSTRVPIAGLEPEYQVAFPVAGHYPVSDLGWPLGDHDLGSDELLAPLGGSGTGNPQRPAGPQASRSEERRVGKGCRSRWSPEARMVSKNRK